MSVSEEDLVGKAVDWELFYSLAKGLARKIQASGYRPDFVLGLTPGGWILGRVLGDFLGVKNMISLRIEHWGLTEAPDGEAPLRYSFRGGLSGRRVLVVDDIADSEERMNMAMEYVRTLNPLEVMTAALGYIKGSRFIPDFYGDEITRRPVILPWSFTRDLRSIVSKLAGDRADLEELRRRIRRDHGIDVDEQRLSRVLNELDRRSRG